MLERFPPVTRPRMFDVARPELLRKFAMLLLGTPNSPKLWKRFAPPPGLVPPVMSYWTLPEGSVEGELTRVLSPDEVMGGGVWAEEIRQANDRTSEKPKVRMGINWSRSECCPINGEPFLRIGFFTPQTLTTACLE